MIEIKTNMVSSCFICNVLSFFSCPALVDQFSIFMHNDATLSLYERDLERAGIVLSLHFSCWFYITSFKLVASRFDNLLLLNKYVQKSLF